MINRTLKFRKNKEVFKMREGKEKTGIFFYRKTDAAIKSTKTLFFYIHTIFYRLTAYKCCKMETCCI